MINRKNYLRVKRHIQYLRDVEQIKPASADRYWFYLRQLLLWLDDQPFTAAPVIRPTFPVFISQLPGKRDSPSLALESQKTALECARRFFTWMKIEHGREFSPISQTWIKTLRTAPSATDAPKQPAYVIEDEVRKLIQISVPASDLALMRDRAAAAMLFVSGARAAAFVTLPIRAVRLQDLCIDQFPSLGVQTKNSKTCTTYLLEIPELLAVISEWDCFVRENLPDNAPWYPIIRSAWGDQKLTAQVPGENRAGGLDKRLRRLFTLADLPYRSAHTFRHGHAMYGLRRAVTRADVKALSMNMMHEDMRVFDEFYSRLLDDEVRERIHGLHGTPQLSPTPDIEAMIEKAVAAGMSRGLEELGKKLAN